MTLTSDILQQIEKQTDTDGDSVMLNAGGIKRLIEQLEKERCRSNARQMIIEQHQQVIGAFEEQLEEARAERDKWKSMLLQAATELQGSKESGGE